MRLLENRKFIITGFILILLLGFFLRRVHLADVPRHGATFDEFAWTWLGINLITKHEPISWSPHPLYTYRKEIRYQGAAFLIVRPYLEHPPLFGLVTGSFTLLRGARTMYDVTLQKMRPLALLLGIFSIIMIFLYAKEVFGETIALISSLLYATVPTLVIGSRIVQNENFLIPFWLLSLYLVSVYLKTKKVRYRNSAITIAGLLTLAKVPWFVVSVSLIFLLVYHKRWKDAAITGIFTLLIFSAFLFYGMYFDANLFLKLWGLQLARYDIHFVQLYSIFTKPLLVDRTFIDGWIYFGYLSVLALAIHYKKYVFILFPFLAYLLLFTFAIPDESAHGWYRYPFYPFLIMSIAVFLKEYFNKNSVLTFLFLLFVGTTLFNTSWVPLFGFSHVVYRTVLVGFSISLVPIFISLRSIEKYSRYLNYGWVAVFILLNIWTVLIYNDL